MKRFDLDMSLVALKHWDKLIISIRVSTMPGGNPASLVKIRLSVAASSSSFLFFSTVIAHKRRGEGGSHKTGEGKEKKREKLKPPRKNNYM